MYYIYLLLLFVLFYNVKCQYKSFAEAKFDLPDNLPSEDPLFQFQKDETKSVIQKPDIKIENNKLSRSRESFNTIPQMNLPQVNLPQVNLPQMNLPQVNLPQVNSPQMPQPLVNGLGFQQITPSLQSQSPTGAMYLPEMLELPRISEVNGIPQTPPLPFEREEKKLIHLPSGEKKIPQAHLPNILFNRDEKKSVVIAHSIPTFKESPIDIHKNRFNGVPRIVQPSKIYKNPRNEISIIPSKPLYDAPSSAINSRSNDVKNYENENYFLDTYNITDCPRDSRYVADLFYQKFPRNTLAPGKEVELINLLGPRLEQCYLKKEKNHWHKVETFFGKINVNMNDEEGCKVGLIQEQIACINLISYSCQFVQHDYQFKLIAARTVLGEARQAEAGENKCREVVKAIKNVLMKSG